MVKRSDVHQLIGVVVIVLVAVAVVVGGLYLLTGTATPDGLRWWATGATLAIPIAFVVAWKLATRAAAEHVRGFNRGLDGAERTMQTVGRGLSATASMARAAKSGPAPTLAAQFDGLLPRPGGATITIRKPVDDEIIL